MPCSESTQGRKSARKFIKKLRKKGLWIQDKIIRPETPTTNGYGMICWSKTKRPGFKRY